MSLIIEKAKEKIKENKYSLDSWNILIKDALDKNIEETRSFFEELVRQFPTCGRFWKIYIEQELKSKNYENVEKLFEHSLKNILQIDLWKSYLSYIKDSKVNEQNYKKLLTERYDFVLEKIGLDVMSYSIWNDYLNHLKSCEQNAESPEEKDQLKQSIRKVYLDALRNPMVNVEQIWKDFCAFENQSENENSKILIEEISKDFQNLKRLSREYESVTRPLEKNWPALPPGQMNNYDEEIRQLQAWKRYILWEKQNPLKLQSQLAILKRVLFAYEQSFLCLAYHCDIWYESICYLIKISKLFNQESNCEAKDETKQDDELKRIAQNKACDFFEKAINLFMQNSLLMHLIYADFEELRTNYQKVYEIYEKCLQNPNIDATLVWIHYIRFVRRNEDIAAARKLFRRAREDSRSTYHLFIANAHLEYYCTKDKTIGFKIFQLGAKKYSNEPDYMLAFIKYMSHLNEDNNTRVLFERILSSEELPPQNANEIWSEFLKFECAVGDLASILKVDKKRQKNFESLNTSEYSESTIMIDRYKYMDLLPCNSNELKSMGYHDIPSKQMILANQSTSLFPPNMSLSPAEYALAAANQIKKAKFPVPDTSQMLPFKPVRNSLPVLHSISGGVFPFPPAVTDLVKHLPPPSTFEGPFVKIDLLIKLFNQTEFSEDFQPLYVHINGEPIRDMENISISNNSNISASTSSNPKRSLLNSANSDDEDSRKSKSMDIYKQRQYKKLIKNP